MPAADATDAKKTKTAKVKEVKVKELPEGVLIYDRDANVLNVCIGCKYNNEDPAVAFTSSTETDAAATEEAEKAEKKTAKTAVKKSSKTKVAKIKPVHYTGTKVIETTAARYRSSAIMKNSISHHYEKRLPVATSFVLYE